MRALCGHCAGTVRALCGHCAGTVWAAENAAQTQRARVALEERPDSLLARAALLDVASVGHEKASPPPLHVADGTRVVLVKWYAGMI